MPFKSKEDKRAYMEQYYSNNRAMLSKKSTKWGKQKRADDPDYFKNAQFKRRYGITLFEFKALLDKQGGLCALCDRTLKLGGGRKTVHVDHCHKSRKVRAILCAKCNVGIGNLGDDFDGVMKAVSYLQKYDTEPTWRNFHNQ